MMSDYTVVLHNIKPYYKNAVDWCVINQCNERLTFKTFYQHTPAQNRGSRSPERRQNRIRNWIDPKEHQQYFIMIRAGR